MRPELVRITKEIIFKYISQEDIFEKYLGFRPDLSKQYLNPLRKDTKAGCSFYYREGTSKLVFHDFAWGTQWDCFDVVQQDYNINFSKALEKIAHDFGLFESKINFVKQLPSPALPKNKIGNMLEIKRKTKFTDRELEFWNIGGLRIDEETLRNRKIFSISHLWEHIGDKTNVYSGLNMTFAYQWEGNIFQIYSPNAKQGHRKFINPLKIKVGDTEFLNKDADHIVITKSKKDSFFLSLFGVNCCFVIHEGIIPDEETLKMINHYPNKFTLFDNDRPGLHNSWRFRKDYGTIPLYYEKQEGKDTTEVLKTNGKGYLLGLIEYLVQFYDINLLE